MKKQFDISEIDSVAKEVITALGDYKLVRMIGEMGAGKTTLIKSICKQLGVEEEVNSPTFAIVNEYKGSVADVFHFDFYRVNTLQEAIDLGLDEYLYSDHYVFMEWPQLVDEYLPDEVATITIKEIENGLREVEVCTK
ncbi:MAG: tRNA (adenosine(37)-N6)-threonylcarbamoyltransferase complex ATPase subunit type 1 TsaE [Paludibacteraceae bacterium]|nr:tRNA (adenosine(37)-N6)-threonylcarbamoyltransferase complex ATPase subunit type 1 TsaE [Paludibacteraceae bacterium]